MKGKIHLIFFLLFFVIASCSDDLVDPLQSDNIPYIVESTTEITNNSNWEFHFRYSNDNQKIAFARYDPNSSKLGLFIWDKTDDSIKEVVTGLSGDVSPTWNPDDTEIAFDARDERDVSQIYIYKLSDGSLRKLTNGYSNSFRPHWSHDGEKIAFVYQNKICIKNIPEENIISIPNTNNSWNPVWNNDDTKILFSKNQTVCSINEDGSELVQLVSSNSDNEIWPKWSPNSEYILYTTFNGENSNIAIRHIKSGDESIITSSNNCRFPDWSADGLSVAYGQNTNLYEIKLVINK